MLPALAELCADERRACASGGYICADGYGAGGGADVIKGALRVSSGGGGHIGAGTWYRVSGSLRRGRFTCGSG